jgi:hypothetical protein
MDAAELSALDKWVNSEGEVRGVSHLSYAIDVIGNNNNAIRK